ncbi:MAG: SurA N-terminal domain-containing protein [Prevotella sp.]|nr:SurA N-terminal domain-containing protein [Prevotella sp.]MCM1074349.1 SurA N-terminal domain-containing protein [Ruminococcus sp.]
MATLEKIRKKSVLLIVLIGAALLAFILGDAINNGRTIFGSGSTVAELGDAKVDISEYQQRVEIMQNANEEDPTIPQQAIDMLLDEKLLDQAADKMGIEVSDEMVTYFLMDIPMGQQGHPLAAVNMFVNSYFPQLRQLTPNATPENLMSLRYWYNVIFTPEKYGVKAESVSNMKQAWLAMESQAKNEVRRMLYQQLLTGLVQPNALEKQAMYAEQTDMSTIDYAFKPYPEDLSAYKVSDKELQDEYEKSKNEFRLVQETKTIGVLAYHVTPSDADKKNAQKLQEEAKKVLASGGKLGKDLLNAGVTTQKLEMSASAILKTDPMIGSFVQNAPIDSIGVFENNGFTLVKVISNSKMANDGAQVAFVGVQKEQLAGVKEALAAGEALDSVISKYTAEQVMMMNQPQMLDLQTPDAKAQLGQIDQNIVAKLDNAVKGDVFEVESQSTPELTVLAYVEDVKPQVPVYELEIMSYALYPSKETIENASAAMSKYANANNTPAKFAAGAKKAGYTYINEAVTASTPGIMVQPQDMMYARGYYKIPNNKLISWVMTDAEPGNISEVIYNEDRENPFIYIAMVEDEYEDFIPYTDTYVKSKLEKRIQTSKAGDEMVKKYSGKGDINATAQAMEAIVIPGIEVSYAAGGQISEKPILARIAGTAKSNKVSLLKGKKGVYAVVVKDKKPSTAKMTKEDGASLTTTYRQKYLNGNKSRRLLRGNERKTNRLFEMTGTR